jgi:hypothetical protein
MIGTIKNIEDFIIFYFKLKHSDFNICENYCSINIKIKKYFFNIKRLQKKINDIRPFGVVFLCKKFTFIEWLLIKINSMICERGVINENSRKSRARN